jgi:hypothetical protein
MSRLLKDKRNLTLLIAFLGAAVAAVLTYSLWRSSSLSPQDGYALVRGRSEAGYEFVGFIVSDKNKVCAATLLNQDTIITAGHCLAYSAGERFYFGTGDFTTEVGRLAQIAVIKFAPGFNPNTGLGPDLAIAKLNKTFPLNNFAKIATATENCLGSIVAYGAGVQSGVAGAELFHKKAGEGCVRAITNNFLIAFNQEVGMCFGDSGGPIFAAPGSDQLIGVLSGGLVDPKLDTLVCDPGNTGYAVTAANYSEFANNFDNTNQGDNYRVIAESNDQLRTDFSRLVSGELGDAEGRGASAGTVSLQLPDASTNLGIVFYSVLGVVTLGALVILFRPLR